MIFLNCKILKQIFYFQKFFVSPTLTIFLYFLIILQNYTTNLKIYQIWQSTDVRHGGRRGPQRL
jgi:hypothetical protein